MLKVNCPHTLYAGITDLPKPLPPSKMLCIPNGCRNANQKDNGKSNSNTENGECDKSTSNKCVLEVSNKENNVCVWGVEG